VKELLVMKIYIIRKKNALQPDSVATFRRNFLDALYHRND